MYLNKESLSGFLLALIVSGASAAANTDEPRVWLERMNHALTTRNYDGVFSHWHGGKVETLRILHRVQNGEVRERLVSLDGSGREFIRTGTELACYLPDKRTVLVERRRAEEGPLLGNLPSFEAANSKLYKLESLARTRLMGRETRLVAVNPGDEFRYGYRLWIDESTGMPLKTQLCDGRGRVIEQIVFASLTLPSRIPDSAFRPDVSTEGFQWLRNDSPQRRSAGPVLWSALNLPPGFRMMMRGAQVMSGSRAPVAHLVFTDGMASVSVFVEPRREAPGQNQSQRRQRSGATRLGSSSAFSTVVDGHQVTAVGEVPPATVRFIATSVKAQPLSLSGPHR